MGLNAATQSVSISKILSHFKFGESLWVLFKEGEKHCREKLTPILCEGDKIKFLEEKTIRILDIHSITAEKTLMKELFL